MKYLNEHCEMFVWLRFVKQQKMNRVRQQNVTKNLKLVLKVEIRIRHRLQVFDISDRNNIVPNVEYIGEHY